MFLGYKPNTLFASENSKEFFLRFKTHYLALFAFKVSYTIVHATH